MPRAKILTMPAPPNPNRALRGHSDPRYIEGQRVLVEAIRYLVQSGLEENLAAVELLSEHFRSRFRLSDHPNLLQLQRPNPTT